MLRVFSYTADSPDPEDELWRAVELFNADLEMLAGADRAIAAAYRLRCLRSFSTGDGFSVLPHEGSVETFWVSNGFGLLRQNGPFPVLGLDGEHGSQPLGGHVTYLIPAVDDLVREGLFEIGGSAEEAVAVHHGVAVGDIVVLAGPGRSARAPPAPWLRVRSSCCPRHGVPLSPSGPDSHAAAAEGRRPAVRWSGSCSACSGVLVRCWRVGASPLTFLKA
ncbi:hypothetical protein [Streptomyces luteireticuli]|uniref:hypothetical protein n=1 Tax=Streptomyces luteireticuli TaxID=173858 RepID=UPI00355716E8